MGTDPAAPTPQGVHRSLVLEQEIYIFQTHSSSPTEMLCILQIAYCECDFSGFFVHVAF